jgi:hypothetical protein
MNNLSDESGHPSFEENYFYQFYDNLEGIVIPIRGDSS